MQGCRPSERFRRFRFWRLLRGPWLLRLMDFRGLGVVRGAGVERPRLSECVWELFRLYEVWREQPKTETTMACAENAAKF